MPQRQIPYVKNVTGDVATDGKSIALDFEAKDGSKFAIALTPEDGTKLVSFILGLAQNAGAVHSVKPARTETIPANLITVGRIGVGRGRSDSEAALGFDVGPLTLTFAVEVSTLLGMCGTLQSMTSVRPNPPKPN